ncbi:MAG: hypothetical protein IJX24_01000 [Oscillospiraceae bacterium]|nr:hypothetical protein [Oscillospiraceae bacterium]
MEIYLLFAIFIAFSIFWSYLWVKTCKVSTVKRLIIHTIIFILLSLVVAYLTMRLIFLPVNDNYSASNIGAVGILYLMFLVCFGIACFLAVGITIENFINANKNKE